MATKLLPKSSYHHGDLESALVEAAITLVRKYGPDHLSLRAVSAEVGVSPSASYHYFRDKDSLISAVGDLLFAKLAEMQEKAIEKISGKSSRAAKERFEALGNAYFKWAIAEPNLYRLIFGGFCEHDLTKSHDSKAWQLLSQSLDELYETGLITKNARIGGEVVVWSAVHGASSLIIEGLMPKNSFSLVISSLQRSLGIK
jgi:AcrR family transcriptional regulator